MLSGQKRSGKLSSKFTRTLIVACLGGGYLITSACSNSWAHVTKVEVAPSSKPLIGDFDWHVFKEASWKKNLSFQQKIDKLEALRQQLAESDRPIVWLGLLEFEPDEITDNHLPSFCSLLLKCADAPVGVSLIAENQWRKLVSVCVNSRGANPNSADRVKLMQSLAPRSSYSLPPYDVSTVEYLVALYYREKNSNRLDRPEAMLLMEILLKVLNSNKSSVHSKIFLDLETDILDRMTEQQAALLELMPDVPDGSDEPTRRAAIVCLTKKLSLVEKFKRNQLHTRTALASEYFSLGQFKEAELILKSAMDSAQHILQTIPNIDQGTKSEAAVLALYLARLAIVQGNLVSARSNLDIAKNILPELSNDMLRQWEPAILMIESEIASKEGKNDLAESLYQQVDNQFDVRRNKNRYERFLKDYSGCKIILPTEQTNLVDWISLLKKENKLVLAEEKSKTLEKIKSDTLETELEESLRERFTRFEITLSYPYLEHDDLCAKSLLSVILKSPCKSTHKWELIERFAKTLIEHSLFSQAIELINSLCNEPSLIPCEDFDLHAIDLQQLKIRAEATSGQFQEARIDSAEFLAKSVSTNPRLRNQRFDVRGWEARADLLSGQREKARQELEQLCAEWNKGGTNSFISDFREHLRDLAIAYYEVHEYELAAHALRYYLKNISYNNGSEAYLARAVLARCYQKLGNSGLAEPLIDEVVSLIKDGQDDVDRIYAITYIADFYLDSKEQKLALKYFCRAQDAITRLKLQKLPVATYLSKKVQSVEHSKS